MPRHIGLRSREGSVRCTVRWVRKRLAVPGDKAVKMKAMALSTPTHVPFCPRRTWQSRHLHVGSRKAFRALHLGKEPVMSHIAWKRMQEWPCACSRWCDAGIHGYHVQWSCTSPWWLVSKAQKASECRVPNHRRFCYFGNKYRTYLFDAFDLEVAKMPRIMLSYTIHQSNLLDLRRSCIWLQQTRGFCKPVHTCISPLLSEPNRCVLCSESVSPRHHNGVHIQRSRRTEMSSTGADQLHKSKAPKILPRWEYNGSKWMISTAVTEELREVSAIQVCYQSHTGNHVNVRRYSLHEKLLHNSLCKEFLWNFLHVCMLNFWLNLIIRHAGWWLANYCCYSNRRRSLWHWAESLRLIGYGRKRFVNIYSIQLFIHWNWSQT